MNSFFNVTVIKPILIGLISIVVHINSANANENESSSSSLQLHGFITQGAIWTDDNNFYGESTNGTADFRELGINFSVQPNSDLLLSGQAISRNAGSTDDGHLRVDYLQANYTIDQSIDGRWGLRLGRVKIPSGFYNDTRDVDSTRPSAILPQSIYYDRTGSLIRSADSAYVFSEHYLPSGDLFLDIGFGYQQTDSEEFERTMLLNKVWEGNMKSDLSMTGRALYEAGDGSSRYALSIGEANLHFEGTDADKAYSPLGPLLNGSNKIQTITLSAEYEFGDLVLTGEHLRQFISLKNYGLIPDQKYISDKYFMQAAYQYSHDVEFLLRYDVSYADNADKDGSAGAAQSGLLLAAGLPALAAHNSYARDWTLGVRWDFAPNWIFRAEHHWVSGTNWLPRTDNNDIAATEKDWNMFMMTIGYSF